MNFPTYMSILVLSVVATALLMQGCNQPNDYALDVKRESPAEKPKTKWKVEGQGYFNAGYNNNSREILIITSPAGRRYLAITGCGVTEIRLEDDGTGNGTLIPRED